MKNYYVLLGINQSVSEEEIKSKIKEKKRLWTQRQNAPKPEQQQEASNNLRVIPEIEETLLNASKRAEYDKKLSKTPKEEGQVDTSEIELAEDLIQEGWQLIAKGNIPDALYIATKATEKHGDNPDAWALLGYCKAQWGEMEDAIYEYKRAIKLRPNEASYYYDLGGIYETIENWQDAMKQYQRATNIDPSQVVYRASMGSVFIKNNMFKEGINILEECLRDEPNNESYKYLLAIAYTESTYQNWTFVSDLGQYLTTSLEHVEEAEKYLEKADKLNVSDRYIKARIDEIRESIEQARKRRFHGNWLVAGVNIVFGIIGLASSKGQSDTALVGLIFIGLGILYIVSCMTPQYRMNKRILKGEGEPSSTSFLSEMMSGEGGCLGLIFGLFIIQILIPFIIIFNFIRNYAMK